jgi:hypothetical protein
MDMEVKNEEIIDLSNEEPEFFIDTVPSSMNRTGVKPHPLFNFEKVISASVAGSFYCSKIKLT